MTRCDILNLEWGTNTRDTNIVEPVLVSLEERFGYKVVRSSIWYGLFKILRYNPKALLISNDTGAVENVRMFQLANSLGIKTITLVSEGLWMISSTEKLRKGGEELSFWGNNLKKDQYLDLKLLWSKAKKDLYIKFIPEAKKYNLRVSGGTGFDRYHFLDYMNKKEFENKYQRNYEKIILIIGYAFDLYPLYGEDVYEKRKKDEMMWLYNQRFIVRDIYEKMVKNNPEVLFILKDHPGSINLDDTEFAGISEKYANTIRLCKEEEIGNLLSVSDIVIAFDSTVCLEAWLLGRETILLNPLGKEFRRSSLYKGSPIVESYDELTALVEEYYKNGTMLEFQKRKEDRELCIKEQIQYGDGANYLRASKLIDIAIKDNTKKKKSISKDFLIELLREAKCYFIEKTPIGFLNKNAKRALIKRSRQYKKEERTECRLKYKRGIVAFEKNYSKLVIEILTNYEG